MSKLKSRDLKIKERVRTHKNNRLRVMACCGARWVLTTEHCSVNKTMRKTHSDKYIPRSYICCKQIHVSKISRTHKKPSSIAFILGSPVDNRSHWNSICFRNLGVQLRRTGPPQRECTKTKTRVWSSEIHLSPVSWERLHLFSRELSLASAAVLLEKSFMFG